MKTYYAVIDTNVIVSSFLRHDSLPGRIVDLATEGTINSPVDQPADTHRVFRSLIKKQVWPFRRSHLEVSGEMDQSGHSPRKAENIFGFCRQG